MASANKMESRLRLSGVFVLLGLIVMVASLRWAHPTAFLVFAFIGGPLVFLGIAIFLYSLVSVRETESAGKP
jgi:RsiW-degrading membrane proteinase PrsW (M82 family)